MKKIVICKKSGCRDWLFGFVSKRQIGFFVCLIVWLFTYQRYGIRSCGHNCRNTVHENSKWQKNRNICKRQNETILLLNWLKMTQLQDIAWFLDYLIAWWKSVKSWNRQISQALNQAYLPESEYFIFHVYIQFFCPYRKGEIKPFV